MKCNRHCLHITNYFIYMLLSVWYVTTAGGGMLVCTYLLWIKSNFILGKYKLKVQFILAIYILTNFDGTIKYVII